MRSNGFLHFFSTKIQSQITLSFTMTNSICPYKHLSQSKNNCSKNKYSNLHHTNFICNKNRRGILMWLIYLTYE